MTARLTLADVESAVASLAALGATAEEVAAALIAKGITALPGCAYGCIVVEGLITESDLDATDEIEVDGKVGASGWHVRVWRDDDDECGGGGSVDLPEHLGDLAHQFDTGRWPELVAKR